jgi:chromate transporter
MVASLGLVEDLEEKRPVIRAPRACGSPWWEIASVFLKLGAMSPGGPGLTGVLQTEIQEKRAWLSKAQFVEGVALVHMLRGSSATQLSILLGYTRAGWQGGILAGLCFILPAFVIMLALTLLYTHYSTLPRLRGVFSGLNPVVVGIFAVAVYRLSTSAITDITQGMLALASALTLGFTSMGIVPILLLTGALGVARYGSKRWGLVATAVGASLHGALVWSSRGLEKPALTWFGSGLWASSRPPGLWQIGLFFAKVGIFTFGGGLILLTFLQEHIVHHLQWLTPQEFLDGLALGRLTPGPIPVLAAFIGYKVSGLAGGHPSRSPYQ